MKRQIILIALLALSVAAKADELKLADPFGDSMVLQRDIAVPVWGQTDAGAAVTVSFAGQTKLAKADDTGRWMVKLDPLMASAENRVLTVSCGSHKVEVKDVLVGEVWLCSGQSNMEMGVPQCDNAAAEIAAANYPAIRLRYTNKVLSPVPLSNINGSPWMVCTPGNIVRGTWSGFSASAYYFGRELHTQLKVPVGLIQSSWGGTYIEPWTTPDGFRMVPKLNDQSLWLDKVDSDYRNAVKQQLELLPSWEKAAREALAKNTPLPAPLPGASLPINNVEHPTALYNAMIAPWVPYAIRGAIWYQGEANCCRHDGMRYYEKMKALIGGWRKVWGEGDFPFYFVQLAPYRYNGLIPTELPELWEAQEESLKIPQTGMAAIQDIGIVNNIHPTNKQDVGKRLARLALARTYGQQFTDDAGPLFRAITVKGDGIEVQFDHANSGLASRDGKPLTGFEIAGADGKFVPADAEIAGSTVLVKSSQVPAPMRVRFAWFDYAEPNLINGEKLPAAAFRAPRNLAFGAPYSTTNPNTHGWGVTGQLTDGSWVADAQHSFATNEDDKFPKEVTVDLEEIKTVRQLCFGVPEFGSTKTIVASVSPDGKTFTEVGRHDFAQEKAEVATLNFTPVPVRFIKLTALDRHNTAVKFPIGFVFLTELEAY